MVVVGSRCSARRVSSLAPPPRPLLSPRRQVALYLFIVDNAGNAGLLAYGALAAICVAGPPPVPRDDDGGDDGGALLDDAAAGGDDDDDDDDGSGFRLLGGFWPSGERGAMLALVPGCYALAGQCHALFLHARRAADAMPTVGGRSQNVPSSSPPRLLPQVFSLRSPARSCGATSAG